MLEDNFSSISSWISENKNYLYEQFRYLILLFWSWILSFWNWIGENKEEIQAFGSILTPLAVFFGSGFVQLFIALQNRKNKEKDDLVEKERDRQRQKFTELIAKRDRESAVERLRMETVSSYFDRMTLLIEKSRSTSGVHSNIYALGNIAKALTISTLKDLDADRNRIVTTFLHEAKLIQDSNRIFLNKFPLLYEANLEGANLKNSFLKDANLKNSNLEGANLENTNLTDANLENANLRNANLENANLTGATLNNAVLNNANLQGATLNSTALNNANLQGANLSNAKLHNTKLIESKLNYCNLFQAEIIDSIAINAKLRKANLINSIINNSNFRNAFFKYAKLSFSEIANVNLRDANLRSVTFKNELILKKSEVIPVRISSNMSMELLPSEKITISGKAKLKNIKLSGATLDSADFRGAILEEVDWTEVKYSDIAKPIFPQDFDYSQVEIMRAKQN